MLHCMTFKYCPKDANSFNLQKNLNTYKDSKELCDKLFFMIIYLETHTHVAELVPTDLLSSHHHRAPTMYHSKANPN